MIDNLMQMEIENMHEIQESLKELTTISLFYKPIFIGENLRNLLKEKFEQLVFDFNKSLETNSYDINANYVF